MVPWSDVTSNRQTAVMSLNSGLASQMRNPELRSGWGLKLLLTARS